MDAISIENAFFLHSFASMVVVLRLIDSCFIVYDRESRPGVLNVNTKYEKSHHDTTNYDGFFGRCMCEYHMATAVVLSFTFLHGQWPLSACFVRVVRDRCLHTTGVCVSADDHRVRFRIICERCQMRTIGGRR